VKETEMNKNTDLWTEGGEHQPWGPVAWLEYIWDENSITEMQFPPISNVFLSNDSRVFI
jgi:hypothetical protein